MAGLNTLTNQLATLSVTINAVNSRILRLENAFRSTHWFNNTLPVYYWAMFSTYSQNGGWYSQNDASQYLGVNPSNWGDNSYSLIHMASDKVPFIDVLHMCTDAVWSCVLCALHRAVCRSNGAR